jgi:hypothetical protein
MSIVREVTVGTLDRLAWQAQDAIDQLVLPTWLGPKHGYDRLLYGVVMNTMALADRISFYRDPKEPRQTARLRTLFGDLGADHEAAAVAVQMWRHTLFHAGDPLTLTDRRTGTQYTWVLHWGEAHLPREQHMAFSDAGGIRVLGFGAMHGVADLRQLSDAMLTAAEQDPALGKALLTAHQTLLQRQTVKFDI